MPQRIDRTKDRDALKPRHEPYWQRVRLGCYIGYRKLNATAPGTWSARFRDSDTGERETRSLGRFDSHPPAEQFDRACAAAEVWFKHKGAGGNRDAFTVGDACTAYVERLLRDERPKTATDATGRFKRWIHSNPQFAGLELLKLKQAQVRKWREQLAAEPVREQAPGKRPARPRSKSTINRDMSALRAALNQALDDGHVTTDAAWRVALTPFENVDGRRTTYLDKKQRRALISSAPPDLAVFLRGMSLLPLRPGALAALSVGDFDARHAQLTIKKDKTGSRQITLPPATAALLVQCAKDKLPAAPMFCRADGARWNKDSWKGPIKDAVTRADLPAQTTAYTLRHSTITDLVVGGLDLLTTAQISGTSVAMIERHYGHLRREHAKVALAGLTL